MCKHRVDKNPIQIIRKEQREVRSEICFIHVRGPSSMSMSWIYTNYLTENGIPYDLITLELFGNHDAVDAQVHYQYNGSTNTLLGKIRAYFGYRLFVRRILRENKYQFIVVWSEVTAVFLTGLLGCHYSGRYCINIRDLMVNKRAVLNRLLFKQIRDSAFTTVSSEKYLEYLPSFQNKYIFFHSYNDKIRKELDLIRRKRTNRGDRITIVFVGQVRFYEHFLKFIDEIANDNRYYFIIAGFSEQPVRDYVEKQGIKNVELTGAFAYNRTAEFLSRADVLYNLYGTEDLNLRTALSNKLYYAICLNTPILAYRNTYTYEIADKAGIAYGLEEQYSKHSFANAFYEWYYNRNLYESEKKCEHLLKEAQESQEKLILSFKVTLEGLI